MELKTLDNCPDCGTKPGEWHRQNCDVERCSVCGGQKLSCDCAGHDALFSRWTGIWPGLAEAQYLGIDDLNQLYIDGHYKHFFIKPKP